MVPLFMPMIDDALCIGPPKEGCTFYLEGGGLTSLVMNSVSSALTCF